MPNLPEIVEELRSKIKKYNEAYYLNNTYLVPDFEYDKLFAELKAMEDKYPELVTEDSPTQKVGGGIQSSFKQVKHSVPMLSIQTETNPSKEALAKWVNGIEEELGQNILFGCELKFDGLAIALHYKYGKLTTGLTRGDGEVGEDVTINVRQIKDIPKFVELWEEVPFVEVRGEVMMTRAVFKQLNEIAERDGKRKLVNPRNAAAGAIRQLDPSVTRDRSLTFYPYTLIEHDPIIKSTQRNSLLELKDCGFNNPYAVSFLEEHSHQSTEQLFGTFQLIGDFRKNIPFDIDGVVFKVDTIYHQEQLGFRSREPRWAIAYKFPPEEMTTKLKGIDVQVGRTGKLTPVARLEPVFVGGTTVANVTLHNVFDLRNRKVRIGDTVIVRRAGDVIPEIAGYIKEDRTTYLPNFHMPAGCPSCGGMVDREKGEKEYRCTDTWECSAQMAGALIHFASKRAMDINGLGDKLIEELVDKNLVVIPSDFYNLYLDRSRIDGWGEKVITKVLAAIEASRVTTMAKVLYGLGIRNVGENTSKILSRHYKTIEDLANVEQDDLQKIDDVGPIAAKSILDFFHENSIMVIVLMEQLTITNPLFGAAGRLSGKTFVITGTLPTLSREDAKKLIEENGGKVGSSVGKTTDYLLAGENAGTKLENAKKLEVRVLDEEQFQQLIKE